jgi:hypothetical protein
MSHSGEIARIRAGIERLEKAREEWTGNRIRELIKAKTCIIGTASGGVFAMRMMLKVSIPVESGNAAIRNGSLGATITRILDELKPEAAYFAEDNGQRTGYIFFDMKDASQLPAIAEPWFLAFNASLTVRPAMNQQDLAASSGGMERAVKGYGKAAA